ncbi:MAG: cardiolipin synthase [Clostridia bacterium]|nr:cardiolipin synthase [Clostridia bacterium]
MKKGLKILRRLHRRIAVILMILLQIAALVALMLAGAKRPWVALCMYLLSGAVIVHIVLYRSRRVALLPWIILIMVFPIFGGLFYFTFHLAASSPFIRRGVRALTAHIVPPPSEANMEACAASYPAHARLMRYLCNAGHYPVYAGTDVLYLPSGEQMLASLLSDLRRARRYIFLEYFIIEDGVMWGQVHEILKEKAKSGVEVRVIYDDIGCFLRVPKIFQKTLESEGIKCRVFNPFRPLFTSLHNHRDHRKIAVIDGEFAYTGGANLADEYINAVSPLGHWKDAAVRLSGGAALSLCAVFLENWCLGSGTAEDVSLYLPPCVKGNVPGALVQPYADTPLDDAPIGETAYLCAISAAKETLYITTPYFIVDDSMMNALILAAKSGVDVRIVTPHIWDKRFVHMATRSYYRELIRGGIRVYEYTPGFIHSKTVVSDGVLSIVGTTNFDYRSLCHHFECGTVIYDREVAAALKEDFFSVLSVSREITEKDCKAGLLRRFFEHLLRIFAPIL